MLIYAARCGMLRHAAVCCGKNDAMFSAVQCRTAPHRNASGVNERLRLLHTVRVHGP